jgi:hypothetical protein
MIDIKRYKEELTSVPLTAKAFVVPQTNEMATTAQPATMPVEQQRDTTGKTYLSNMGLDAEAGSDDHAVQHFCFDCCMPFREDRMVLFRGKWYGVPCGDYKHAVDIFRKERQRAFRPPRKNEPGAVPFVTSTNW